MSSISNGVEVVVVDAAEAAVAAAAATTHSELDLCSTL